MISRKPSTHTLPPSPPIIPYTYTKNLFPTDKRVPLIHFPVGHHTRPSCSLIISHSPFHHSTHRRQSQLRASRALKPRSTQSEPCKTRATGTKTTTISHTHTHLFFFLSRHSHFFVRVQMESRVLSRAGAFSSLAHLRKPPREAAGGASFVTVKAVGSLADGGNLIWGRQLRPELCSPVLKKEAVLLRPCLAAASSPAEGGDSAG